MQFTKIEPKAKKQKADSKQSDTREQNQFALAKGTDEILRTDYPPIRWIVEGLIPEGLTILAGQSKAGKSWFLLQLGLAVAKGERFLECDTVKTKAVYLAIEDSERRLKSRMEYQMQTGHADLQILDRWDGGIDSLAKDLPAVPEVKLVIIDTWGRFVGTKIDGNDYHEVTESIGRLHTLAKEQGIAIIVCTHTKKGLASSDWLDDVIGSKALVGCADTILKLSRDRNSDEGTLDVTGRDVPEQNVAIRRDECWRWTLSERSEMSEECRQVLHVLENSGKALTKDEMKHHSRVLKRADVREPGTVSPLESALSELVEGKRIVDNFRQGNGVKNETIEYKICNVNECTVTEPPKNSGVYGALRYDTPVTVQNTIAEFDAFGEQSPTCNCSNCVHFTSKNYPDRLCAQGYCQQDLLCYDFTKK